MQFTKLAGHCYLLIQRGGYKHTKFIFGKSKCINGKCWLQYSRFYWIHGRLGWSQLECYKSRIQRRTRQYNGRQGEILSISLEAESAEMYKKLGACRQTARTPKYL